MLAILFLIVAAFIFFKIMGLMFRLSWGIGRAIFAIVFIPIVILVLLLGLAWLVLPILIVIGLIVLIVKLAIR